MSDSYVECLVKAKQPTWAKILKVLLIALTVLSCLVMFVFIIFLPVALAAGVGAYFLNMYTDLEYEYLYLDKELSVDKIMAKSKRKRVGTYSLDRMEVFAPVYSYHLDNFKNRQVKEKDYSIGEVLQPDGRYAMYYEGGEKILLSPNEELVKVLFGDYNPAGRLPVTIARNAGVLPCYYGQPRGTGYISAGRFGVVSNRFGYVNEDVHPIYPFGHGLSYTQFEYRDLSVSAEKVPADGAVVVTAEIANTGARDGEEVVQLYVYDQLSSMIRPEFSLVGFGRVSIPAGETRKVSFNVPMSQLAFLDIDMNWKVEGGAMKFLLGASSADIRLEKPFEIVGDAFVDGKSRGFYTVAEVVE